MLFNAILDKHVKLNNPMHVLMTTDHQYTNCQFTNLKASLYCCCQKSTFQFLYSMAFSNKMSIVTEWFKEFIC
ncbi:hypothetical protein T03_674 [Trichinella britovi]|uniref:Uncharacterized protein n=1 Tax=Trichinella britovi TaxID=45882 RepID=A0A0V1CRH5_TRIBR|nr:hypothetical protein T03_674 [Trichinella britovi]